MNKEMALLLDKVEKNIIHLKENLAKRNEQYHRLIQFIHRVSKRGCELVGACDACAALELLREYGEDE